MLQGRIPGTAVQAIILELCSTGACGSLVCEIDSFKKIVTFWRGRVTSATSTLIDDRMGEVIYREGKLSLDTFLETAGRVTRGVRFGELLVRSGRFSPVDLWDALSSQSRAILASLCFYREISITYQEMSAPPKNEFLTQLNLEGLFRESLRELHEVLTFEGAANQNPKLVVDENGIRFADNDFLKDMVVLVQDTGDFRQIVEKGSRLSRIYTVRALYQLYVRGVLKDTLGLARRRVAEGTVRSLRSVIEDGNFMFAELSNVAQVEGVTDWKGIVEGAAEILSRDLGNGHYLNSENGFQFENILRASILLPNAHTRAELMFSSLWPDTLLQQLKNSVHSSILYIFYELFNRKFDSSEFSRVKNLVDGILAAGEGEEAP